MDRTSTFAPGATRRKIPSNIQPGSKHPLVLLAMLAIFVSSGCATTSPQGLYRSVWKATPEHIYDPGVLEDWQYWEHRFDGRLHTQEDATEAINEMLGSIGDRYTYFMDSKAVKADEDRKDGKFTGVGIVFGTKPGQGVRLPDTDAAGYPLIKQLINGSPAKTAGVRPGDAVTSINGMDTRRLSLDELVTQLRGQAGERVKLGLRRQEERWQLTITRATVDVPAVTTMKLPDGIGYLRLEGFEQEDATAEFKAGLEALADCRALVIDLRNNGGGLVYNAIHIASFFIPEGTVVTIKQRIPAGGYKTQVLKLTSQQLVRITRYTGSDTVDLEAKSRQPFMMGNRPVVLLVNGRSASASELFTGAVKDNGRVTVMGTPTFGKGIGQTNIPMPQGTQLHVTSLRYYTPNGTWIGDGGNTQAHGIQPHTVVQPAADLEFGGATDNQLKEAIKVLTGQLGTPEPVPEFRTKASCSG